MTQFSIIIPAFNEAHKIEQDIVAADRFLRSEGIDGEIIIVDDGSSDHTAEAAQKSGNDVQTLCIVERLDQNYGKGRAVRTGILKSTGEFVLFADSGLCVPFKQVHVGINLIRSGQCRIAHGSPSWRIRTEIALRD